MSVRDHLPQQDPQTYTVKGGALKDMANAWWKLGPKNVWFWVVITYQFGDDASKATCLWLDRLPKLDPTRRVPGRVVEWPKGTGKMVERWSNQADSGQNRLSPSDDRWKSRSKTYSGIAKAFADQWTNINAPLLAYI